MVVERDENEQIIPMRETFFIKAKDDIYLRYGQLKAIPNNTGGEFSNEWGDEEECDPYAHKTKGHGGKD